ncbi:MAG TPA: outer membrane lipoprotein carrier protein LolA [Polyangiaceae bacterium]|nr:outer membrane lipoprotein carrier protein LolA [Polyangiaceae bacterium]
MRWLIALVLLLWAGPIHAEDARSLASRVQRVYDDTKTYQAKFRQTYVIKVQNVRKVSSGRVAFAKPGKLSFRYDEGNRVVSDGKTVKVYERGNQQMYENEVARSQYPAALAFLIGEGRLSRDFKLRLLDAKRMKVKNAFVLEGVPRDASPAYEKILFYIDAATAQVRRVLVLDAQGNRNRFDFSQPVLNKPVTGGEFRFTPPRGTTVVKP